MITAEVTPKQMCGVVTAVIEHEFMTADEMRDVAEFLEEHELPAVADKLHRLADAIDHWRI